VSRLVSIGDDEAALFATRGQPIDAAVVMRLARGGEIRWQRPKRVRDGVLR